MLNRLLQEFYQSPNNGKQIARLNDEARLLVTHSEISGTCEIGVRAVSASRVDDLTELTGGFDLVGRHSCIGSDQRGFGGCVLTDDDERVHVAWTTPRGIRHTHAHGPAAMDPSAWSQPEYAVPGDAWLGDFLRIGDWSFLLYRVADGIGLAILQEGCWTSRDLWEVGPVWPPVGVVDDKQCVHIVWGDAAGTLWYGMTSLGEAQGAPQRVSLQGQQPSIAVVGDRVLVVYEDRLSHIHYLTLRDGEVVDQGPITWRNPWFMGDLVHSPQLSTDRHGVVWCFFADNTRRSTFWTRWMGEGFGETYNGPRIHYRSPHYDWNLLPVGRLSVEKTSEGGELGMVLGLERPLKGQSFRSVPVPGHPSEAGCKVLFLDGLEMSEIKGVDLRVEEAQRHGGNPLLDVGPEGSFDSDRVFNHGTVLRGGSGYRMWYGAIHEPLPGEQPAGNANPNDEDRTNPQSVPWWDTITCGYAESSDGVDWERSRLGLVEWKGSKDNNLVPHLRHAPLMIRDDSDPDPDRRYKSLYVWNSGEMCEMAAFGKYEVEYDLRDEYFPAILFTSPDGIDLTPQEARVVFKEGEAKPFSIIPQSLFRDDAEPDPAKRWKAYGFTSLNLRRRGTALIYSEDLLTWYAHSENPILDPSVRGTPAVVGGPECQIHDTVVFPYVGYYLALYQYQHNSEILDVELAMSRDSETFVHVQPGSKILPLGQEAWESEHLFPTVPVMDEEEVRIYYGGGRMIDVPLDQQKRLGKRSLKVLPGLATLRTDGFTSVGMKAAGQGSLTTLPFQLEEPCQLRLNANCRADCSIVVEVLEPVATTPMDGYSIEDGVPVTEDAIAFAVRWRESKDLPIGV